MKKYAAHTLSQTMRRAFQFCSADDCFPTMHKARLFGLSPHFSSRHTPSERSNGSYSRDSFVKSICAVPFECAKRSLLPATISSEQRPHRQHKPVIVGMEMSC